jgi:hypothetical protein
MSVAIDLTPAEIRLVLALRDVIAKPDSAPSQLPKPPPVRWTAHDPSWKTPGSGGRQLSTLGKEVIAEMILAGLPNTEISRLMKIGPGSASTYRARVLNGKDWGRYQPQASRPPAAPNPEKRG